MLKKNILKVLGNILIVGLFIYLILNTDFGEIFNALRKAHVLHFAGLITLQFFTQFLLILQWHRISKKVLETGSFSKISYVFTKGSVIEAITPGAKIGGEATRLYYLKKILNAPTDKAINIILIQKSISMSVLMLVCIVCLMDLSRHIKKLIGLPFQIAIMAIFLSLVLLMITSLLFSSRVSTLLSKSENTFVQKINKFILSYSKSVISIGKKEWIIQFLISIMVWVLFPVKMYILVKSFDLNLDLELTTAITMTSYMMGMLPITPGGLGTFEATMLALLSVFTTRNGVGVAITIIFRFVTFWFVIIGSFIYSSIYELLKIGEKNVQK